MTTANIVYSNSINIFASLAFYAPAIVCVCIISLSLFTASMQKSLWFLGWLSLATFGRVIMSWCMSGREPGPDATPKPQICSTGTTTIFTNVDTTYGVFTTAFTALYLIVPMLIISKQSGHNVVNYGVVAFFLAYLALIVGVMQSYSCISGVFDKWVLCDLLGGSAFGAVASGVVMFGSGLSSSLFINELSAGGDTCSRPSKQQFKCAVYRNGELVGSANA
jgi:hypothetical protein